MQCKRQRVQLVSAFGQNRRCSVEQATRHELGRSFSEMKPVPGYVLGRVRAQNRRRVAREELAGVVGAAVAAARGQSNVLPEPCDFKIIARASFTDPDSVLISSLPEES